jgi:hypothetical protein
MDNPEDQEQLYRIQLLQAFDMQVWNEEQINHTIMEVFNIVILNADFKNILEKARDSKELIDLFKKLNILDGEEDLIFTMLFKYEYFDLLHSCIADILLFDAVHPTHLTNMLDALRV